MLTRALGHLKHNLIALVALLGGVGTIAAPGCKSLFPGWDELSRPSTAQAPIENTDAWKRAIAAGKAADATATAANLGAMIPGLPMLTPIGNGADAFSVYLYQQLQELKDRQAKSETHLGEAPTQLDVYKAVAGAALAGAGGAFVRRRRSTDSNPSAGSKAAPATA